MKIVQSHIVAFSPCGGTLRVLRAIAPGLTPFVREHDLTLPPSRKQVLHFGSEDLVFFGFPVFGGRLPRIAESVFAGFSGAQTPAVLVAVYGNRDYEDALLEMQQLASARGFLPFAGAAAVAEHSMTDAVGTKRPDAADKAALEEFGRKIARTVEGFSSPAESTFTAPGEFPFRKPAQNLPFVPEASDKCTLCGVCTDGCPTAAIPVDAPQSVNLELCIACQACIKNCPKQARSMNQPKIQEIRGWLQTNYSQVRKEPAFFPEGIAGG